MNNLPSTRASLILSINICALLLIACGKDGSKQASAATAIQNVAVLTDPASGARCDGNDVNITRNDFRLLIEGECGNVVIAASNGTVNISNARSLRLKGSNVTVLNEQVGEVLVAGDDNTLNLTATGPMSIDGNRNIVLARTIEKVAFSGDNNSVNPDNEPPLTDKGRGNKVL
ncbi:MAG TPA: DUF3060 domain-containing protein [Dokdonella sp.]|uniref:DUF3060 domain-containing protein n=1 Tax=Dokdonella sp. TaxID=2291710 RepID=UPI002D7F368A|nr:DUF3060 domain-containing protein [Dokdonella sp.]HET9033579.1 DUF3060 domain-containing protein [Dokdonella sp.]